MATESRPHPHEAAFNSALRVVNVEAVRRGKGHL